MTTAREIMAGGVQCADGEEALERAPRKMAELDAGSLPICGEAVGPATGPPGF